MYFSVKQPEAQSRLKALFRILLIIPILILTHVLTNNSPKHLISVVTHDMNFSWDEISNKSTVIKQYFTEIEPAISSTQIDANVLEFLNTLAHFHKLSPVNLFGLFTGLISLALVITLLFGQYPKWWFNWNIEMTRFLTRITAYALLLTDNYPSIDKKQDITLSIPSPEKNLKRSLVLVKWILALPHWIILMILTTFCTLTVLLSWISIIIAGRQPKMLFQFHEGVLRYKLNIMCYCVLLCTDSYPAFTLKKG